MEKISRGWVLRVLGAESRENLPKQPIHWFGRRSTFRSIVWSGLLAKREIFEHPVNITNFGHRFLAVQQLQRQV
jgi:hypothetical protein